MPFGSESSRNGTSLKKRRPTQIADLFILAHLLTVEGEDRVGIARGLLPPAVGRVDVDAEVAGNLGHQSTLFDQAKGVELELTRVSLATFGHADFLQGTEYVPD